MADTGPVWDFVTDFTEGREDSGSSERLQSQGSARSPLFGRRPGGEARGKVRGQPRGQARGKAGSKDGGNRDVALVHVCYSAAGVERATDRKSGGHFDTVGRARVHRIGGGSGLSRRRARRGLESSASPNGRINLSSDHGREILGDRVRTATNAHRICVPGLLRKRGHDRARRREGSCGVTSGRRRSWLGGALREARTIRVVRVGGGRLRSAEVDWWERVHSRRRRYQSSRGLFAQRTTLAHMRPSFSECSAGLAASCALSRQQVSLAVAEFIDGSVECANRHIFLQSSPAITTVGGFCK